MSVLQSSGLPELATVHVFKIFDIYDTGTISMKEFLFTMLAFRPPDSDEDGGEDEDAAARLYFQIFDINVRYDVHMHIIVYVCMCVCV
jgi:Ca2+-binding EF-hand superfamily protein